MINLRSIAFLLFFFSGFSALVYEVVWTRQFAAIFGSTTESLGVILAVYLSGLALGGVFLGRSGDGTRNPFLLFAILEGLTGLYGLVAPAGFDFLESFYYSGGNTGASPPESLKILLTGLYCIVPCFLMGGTLPVLSRFCLDPRTGRFGTTAGGLYAVNTLGAALGAFFAGFVFLEQFGARSGVRIAGAVNLAVCAAALGLFFFDQRNRREDVLGEPSVDREPASPSWPVKASILVAFFLAGTSTFAHEVVWSRLLSQYLRNSVYSYTCMLIAVLLGLATGGGCGSLLLRFKRGGRALLGAVQLLAGMASLLTVLWVLVPLNDLTGYKALLLGWGGGESFSRLALFEVGFALCLVFPPAFMMGASFPLMADLSWRPRSRFGGFMGDLQFLVVAGNVVGALVTALYLIPSHIGLLPCLLAAVAANLLSAALLFIGAFPGSSGSHRARIAAVALVVGGAMALVYNALPSELRFWKELPEGETLHFYQSDSIAEVAVVENADGLVLKVNNNTWLGGTEGQYVETRLGLLPTLIHGGCENTLVMGLGTGNSLFGVLQGEAINVDCVEIIPAVAAASTLFHTFEPTTPGGGRLRIYPGMDARVFLRCVDEKYDLIVGDLYFPWHSEAGFMYTKEHFARVRDRLTEEGVFFQWLPLHQLRWEDFGVIGYTFAEVFEDLAVFLAAPDAAYPIVALVGSKAPLHLDPITMQARLDQHPQHPLLEAFGLVDALEITSLYLGNEWLFRRGFSETLVNDEDRTVVEFRAARIYEDGAVVSFNNLLKLSDPLFKENAVPILRLPEMEVREKLALDDRVKNRSDALKSFLNCHALLLRELYLRDYGYEDEPLQVKRLREVMGVSALTAFRLAPDSEMMKGNLLKVWKYYMQENEISAADNLMYNALSIRPEEDVFYNNLGLGLIRSGRYGEAALTLVEAIQRDPDNPRARANWALALFLTGERVQAREEMARVVHDAGYEALSGMTAALARLILEGREAALPLLKPYQEDPTWHNLIRDALKSAEESAVEEYDPREENG